MVERRVVELLGPGLHRVWTMSEVLAELSTPYQHVLIGRTAHGVTLFCDDERQSAEASQLVYHEALFVPAMLLADRVERVLVIGSSEGVISRLAISAGARLVDHVDIDTDAVRCCAEHLPYGYTTAELATAEQGTGSVRMHYRDGWEFVAGTSDRYDLVVVDLPDERPDAEVQHNRLYGAEFLDRCARVLTPGGVLTSQVGCPTLWRNETLHSAWRRFTGRFGTVAYYGCDEHEWAFLSARQDVLHDPPATMLARLDGRAYRPRTLDAAALLGGSVPPFSLRASR